ncbi:Metallo-dependent phosphatase-like protein [Geopyxis carbonaria]|nr:Metallo-dependent phosphatase-like protein [Geopyxis carbonaria]
MARRIVRTLIQFTILSLVLAVLLFVLDLRYRVLPPSVHFLLPEHHAGTVVTDLQPITCGHLQLLSSCTSNTAAGWKRVNKDFYLSRSWTAKAHLHVQLKPESEFSAAAGDLVVVDAKVGRIKPDGDGWEQRAHGLWVKRQGKLVDDAVTGADVLFGPDAVEVREGWELKGGSFNVGESPRLTIRRGAPVVSKRPTVRMRKDHKLKIIQVSDLHLSTGVGHCRDAEPASSAAACEADPRTLAFIERILDDEKPDLAVLSGDQVNGDTAPDAATAVFKFAEPFIKRKIPFATILGNHDDEGNLLRGEIMALTASLPYSLSRVGPQLGALRPDRHGRPQLEGGAGNYYIEVLAHKSDHSAVTLWLLDTHSYSPDPQQEGYDWIKPYQIDWFRETHASLKDAHAKYSFMHLDLAFIHIPLPEYRTRGAPMVGAWKEPPTAPRHNSGFRNALVQAGVKVVSAGHDHANDYCLLDQQQQGQGGKEGEKDAGLWMCYAGGSGFGGYGGYGGYHRRVRLWEIDAPADRIRTWKRLEYGEAGRVDEQTVVEGGTVVVPRQ